MSPRDVAAATNPPSVAVTVWIDLGAANTALVYVTTGSNVFARQLDLGRALDSVALDLLDAVVSSSVETVLSGRPIGVSREAFTRSLERPPSVPVPVSAPAPALAPAVPAAPATRPKIGFAATAGYEASWVGPSTSSHGPGLTIDARRGRLRIATGFYLALPYDADANGAILHFRTEGFRLSAGHIFPVRPQLALIVALGIGADVTHVEPASNELDLTPAGSFHTAEVLVRPSVELERRFGRRLTLGLTAGLDLAPAGAAYVIDTAPGTRPAWTPGRVRPVLALAIGLLL